MQAGVTCSALALRPRAPRPRYARTADRSAIASLLASSGPPPIGRRPFLELAARRFLGLPPKRNGRFRGRFAEWWRWRESNSRPEALHSRDYMLSLAIWISFPHRRRTGCGRTSRLALALRPSGPTARDRSKGPRCDLRCYPLIARAERRPVRGPAGLSRQSVRFVVRS